MQIEMEQTISSAGFGQGGWSADLVQALVEARKPRGLKMKEPRPSHDFGRDRRPRDALQHERVGRNVEDARHRVPVLMGVPHDECFVLRITARLEPPEDATITEIEDLGSASGGDQPHFWPSGPPIAE
jgi:hypothetical protein